MQSSTPPYLPALVALEADETAMARLAEAVARDVTGEAAPSPANTAEARDALAWLLASLRAGPLPDEAALRALREDARGEARAGRPLRPVLDRHPVGRLAPVAGRWRARHAVHGRSRRPG